MNLIYGLMTFIAGMTAPVQAGINSTLGSNLNSFFLAALVSFLVGFLGLTCVVLIGGTSLPSLSIIKTIPWWLWLGGLIGAFLVTTTIIAAPKLGATTMIAVLIAGQLVASVLLDHYGLVGYPVHPMSLARVAGVILLFVGVFLIQRY